MPNKVTIRQKICYIKAEDLKKVFKSDLKEIKESHTPRKRKQKMVEQIFQDVPQHIVEFKVDNFLRNKR